MNHLRAVREKCLDCSCQQPVEVKECTVMTKFELISVQGGYIIRYWLAKELKLKVEVYPTASDLMERLNILIPNMEEE